ncbi:TPA: DUF1372 family protein [Streptococcus agalactiae]
MELAKDTLKVAASMIIVLAALMGYSYLMYQSGYNQAKNEARSITLYTVDNAGGFYEYDKELIGIVKQLEGAWVIDTGRDAVDLWTEIDENEVIGNIYENPDFMEASHEQATT